MDKEGEVCAQDDGEALTEVPVPRVRAIEGADVLQHVKLQKIKLNQGPLTKKDTIDDQRQTQSDQSYRQEPMQSEMELSGLLPEMPAEQGRPWNQRCGPDQHSERHQRGVLNAAYGL